MKYLNSLTIIVAIFVLSPFELPAQDYLVGFSNVKYDGEHFFAIAKQRYQVVKLDKTGNVLDKFGKRGRGPDEFSSDDLKLVSGDSLLYVLDSKGFAVTLLKKRKFQPVARVKINKSTTNLILHNQQLYGSVLNLKETEMEGKEIRTFRTIKSLDSKGTNLFKTRNKTPINPFYDGETIFTSSENVIIAREGRSGFTIFNGDSLYHKDISNIEDIALGHKITRDANFLKKPGMDIFWKKKIMPEYMLLKSGYLAGQKMYFQVHSYKEGDVLFKYNIPKDSFTKVASLSQGKLIAVDNHTIYTLDNTTISATTLPKLRSCADEAVVFYLNSDAFEEQCSRCKDSLSKWYDYAVKNNIPVKINMEDDSWFGKKEVSAKAIKRLKQWNIWGDISYKKDCEGCYNSSISARISSAASKENIYSFPESVSILKNSLECVE